MKSQGGCEAHTASRAAFAIETDSKETDLIAFTCRRGRAGPLPESVIGEMEPEAVGVAEGARVKIEVQERGM